MMASELTSGHGAIRCRPAGPDDWPHLEHLFGANGACGGCWCRYWFAPPGADSWNKAKGTANREALREELSSGQCPGILAFAGDDPVGWCRVGPTTSFPRLGRSRKLVRPAMRDWAVVCFYVAPAWRRVGVSVALLRAAVDLAKNSGARGVEGYAVLAKGPSVPPPFAWTGLPSAFEDAGFRRSPHDAGARVVYELELAGDE